MSPDHRGEGATGSGPDEQGTVARPDPESGETAETTPAERPEGDREAGTRERVEEALRRRTAREAAEPDPRGDGERAAAREPAPEGATGEHWSRTVRRRVAEGGATPEAGTPDAEAENAQSAAERSAAAAAAEVRERVERRLLEAEDRRNRRAPPSGAESRPTPASPQPAAADPGPEELPLPPEEPSGWETDGDESPEAPGSFGEIPASRPPSRIAAFIATCAFLGRIPIAPGTAGAAAGLVAFLLTRNLPGSLPVALFVVAVAVGLWAGARHAKDLRQPDPRSVVVDEFCGMWLALVGSNPSVLVMAAAFVAFRFLDIVKPPPVRQAEKLPGGIGIMADDLVAGGVVRIVLLLALGM